MPPPMNWTPDEKAWADRERLLTQAVLGTLTLNIPVVLGITQDHPWFALVTMRVLMRALSTMTIGQGCRFAVLN